MTAADAQVFLVVALAIAIIVIITRSKKEGDR